MLILIFKPLSWKYLPICILTNLNEHIHFPNPLLTHYTIWKQTKKIFFGMWCLRSFYYQKLFLEICSGFMQLYVVIGLVHRFINTELQLPKMKGKCVCFFFFALEESANLHQKISVKSPRHISYLFFPCFNKL